MTRFHATPEGNIPFTPEEEAEWDAWQNTPFNQEQYNNELAYKIREKRNEALRATDWRAATDLVFSQAWRDYRQALRDLPQKEGFPTSCLDEYGQYILPEEPADTSVTSRTSLYDSY